VILPSGTQVDIDTYATQTTPDSYDPYALGSVMATALWQVAAEIDQLGGDREDVFRAVLYAERTLGVAIRAGIIGADGTGFDLNLIAEALASSAPNDTVRRALCRVLLDRWAPVTLKAGAVPSC